MKSRVKKIILSLFLFGFLIFVALNILFSQNFPYLITRIITDQNKNESILFLKKIKDSQEFVSQLNYYKKIYGSEIESEVYLENKKRDEEVKKLEKVLKLNPKARDVLVKLALLYLQKKEKIKAREYYLKGKEIDPWLKIELLEEIKN